MDVISSLSIMATTAAQVTSDYGIAMLSKSLDAAEISGEQLTQMIDSAAMERSVNPNVGANFDVYI